MLFGGKKIPFILENLLNFNVKKCKEKLVVYWDKENIQFLVKQDE